METNSEAWAQAEMEIIVPETLAKEQQVRKLGTNRLGVVLTQSGLNNIHKFKITKIIQLEI